MSWCPAGLSTGKVRPGDPPEKEGRSPNHPHCLLLWPCRRYWVQNYSQGTALGTEPNTSRSPEGNQNHPPNLRCDSIHKPESPRRLGWWSLVGMLGQSGFGYPMPQTPVAYSPWEPCSSGLSKTESTFPSPPGSSPSQPRSVPTSGTLLLRWLQPLSSCPTAPRCSRSSSSRRARGAGPAACSPPTPLYVISACPWTLSSPHTQTASQPSRTSEGGLRGIISGGAEDGRRAGGQAHPSPRCRSTFSLLLPSALVCCVKQPQRPQALKPAGPWPPPRRWVPWQRQDCPHHPTSSSLLGASGSCDVAGTALELQRAQGSEGERGAMFVSSVSSLPFLLNIFLPHFQEPALFLPASL